LNSVSRFVIVPLPKLTNHQRHSNSEADSEPANFPNLSPENSDEHKSRIAVNDSGLTYRASNSLPAKAGAQHIGIHIIWAVSLNKTTSNYAPT
jgi:hypothetical protein